MLGVMSARQALELADQAELDLVKISPNAVPPVCKIMDYGKFCFDRIHNSVPVRGQFGSDRSREVRRSRKAGGGSYLW